MEGAGEEDTSHEEEEEASRPMIVAVCAVGGGARTGVVVATMAPGMTVHPSLTIDTMVPPREGVSGVGEAIVGVTHGGGPGGVTEAGNVHVPGSPDPPFASLMRNFCPCVNPM